MWNCEFRNSIKSIFILKNRGENIIYECQQVLRVWDDDDAVILQLFFDVLLSSTVAAATTTNT